MTDRPRRRPLLPPRGWRRAVALRRGLAAALAGLAVVLALVPRAGPVGRNVVVATHDLGAGVALSAADVAVRPVSPEDVPGGALADPSAVLGRLPVGGVRAGETLTDVRLLGRAAAVAATGVPDAAGVPLRLADAGVAGLLSPGSRVDVVGVGQDDPVGPPGRGHAPPAAARPGGPALPTATTEPDARVLASGAVVLAVLPAAERGAGTPVVVVALPGPLAARVAAASLSRDLTVTLR